MAEPDRQDTTLEFWTIEQAARHFGITRGTVRRYIRGGLATHHHGLTVKPSEFISEHQQRRQRQQQSRKTRAQ
jgi:DeoR/GlpR family transcriptional regulator of sugar metabolism